MAPSHRRQELALDALSRHRANVSKACPAWVSLCPATVLERSGGNTCSLAMDLLDQWQYMQKTGQWRFTPPTHVLAALRAPSTNTIRRVDCRHGWRATVRIAQHWYPAMRDLASRHSTGRLSGSDHRHLPRASRSRVRFSEFYGRVRERGFILYPGKLTAVDTFRVGCIGAINAGTLRSAVAAIAEVLRDMGVRRFSPV